MRKLFFQPSSWPLWLWIIAFVVLFSRVPTHATRFFATFANLASPGHWRKIQTPGTGREETYPPLAHAITQKLEELGAPEFMRSNKLPYAEAMHLQAGAYPIRSVENAELFAFASEDEPLSEICDVILKMEGGGLARCNPTAPSP